MNFKEMMMEKLKVNVAYKVANDSGLIRGVANAVLDDIDYSDIAADLHILSSDVADEIDQSDVLSEIVDQLDMEEIQRAVAERCDMEEIANRVISLLPIDFMDSITILATEEIVADMQ